LGIRRRDLDQDEVWGRFKGLVKLESKGRDSWGSFDEGLEGTIETQAEVLRGRRTKDFRGEGKAVGKGERIRLPGLGGENRKVRRKKRKKI